MTNKGGAKEFMDEVEVNNALQARVQGSATASLSELGMELGYEFTQSELHATMRERWEIESDNRHGSMCSTAPGGGCPGETPS